MSNLKEVGKDIVLTTRAQNQLAKNGYTTACGGVFSEEHLNNVILNNPGAYFKKREPAGIFMETLEKTEKQINDNAVAIRKAGMTLVDTAKDANKQMLEVNSKFREGTDKLSTAIDRLTKIVGQKDYAKTVELTVTLVDSLERLAALEEKGILDKVIKAMSK